MATKPSYVLFWDFSTVEFSTNVSVLNIVREVEKKFYPRVQPHRDACFFYVNSPRPNTLNGEFEKELEDASFKIIKSSHGNKDKISTEELAGHILAELQKFDAKDLVLICDGRDFGRKAHFEFNLHVSNFFLIHGRNINVSEFDYAKKTLKITEFMSFIEPFYVQTLDLSLPTLKLTDHIKVPTKKFFISNEKLQTPTFPPPKIDHSRILGPIKNKPDPYPTLESFFERKNFSKTSNHSRFKADPFETLTPSNSFEENSKNVFQEKSVPIFPNKPGKTCDSLRHIINIKYEDDPVKRMIFEKLLREKLSDLDAYLSFNNGSGTLDLPNEALLEKAKQFIEDMGKLYDVKVVSQSAYQPIDKSSAKHQDEQSSSRNIFPHYPNHGESEKSPCFTTRGYFVFLEKFRKRNQIKFYRESLRCVLGNINLKGIYIDPIYSFAVLEFYSQIDRGQAHCRLENQTLFDLPLHPKAVDVLEKRYVERIESQRYHFSKTE